MRLKRLRHIIGILGALVFFALGMGAVTTQAHADSSVPVDGTYTTTGSMYRKGTTQMSTAGQYFVTDSDYALANSDTMSGTAFTIPVGIKVSNGNIYITLTVNSDGGQYVKS
ncbi:hypothetical protein BIS22_14440 [Lactiplantibacillus pentosus]|uniref:hypothetical protein n=1 Tax=Lactiplantibacillus TaxID=2767842 RepID=UPI000C17EAD0|nr:MULTISPECIES: hypothetical protein [Lactiplantibacillus]MBO2723408.1 hypothetical protein [Lactiplantibacillus plantarum]PKX54677.1 hypothetical protein BIS22_14440 [Lactiplantibacillus pentosus]